MCLDSICIHVANFLNTCIFLLNQYLFGNSSVVGQHASGGFSLHKCAGYKYVLFFFFWLVTGLAGCHFLNKFTTSDTW